LRIQADPRVSRPCQVSHELVQRVIPAGRKNLIFGLSTGSLRFAQSCRW